MELSLKLPRDAGIQKNCKDLIRNAIAQLHFEKRFRSVLVLPDVDAV
jgi:primosomal protein N' (replication factor Y)